MTQSGRYHGGLVFLGTEDGALDRFSRIVTATLEDYGHLVERQTILSAFEARIVSSQYLIKLTLDTEPLEPSRSQRLDDAAGLNRCGTGQPLRARNRLVITMSPVSELLDDRDVSELMLVVMLYRMVDLYASEQIEWLAPDVLLTVDQFLGAFANVSPRRVKGRQQMMFRNGDRFAPIEETATGLEVQYDRISGSSAHRGETGLISLSDEEALALAFRCDPRPDQIDGQSKIEKAQSDIQRLTSWGITGCLAFVAAPVAVSLAAVNLIRGEDFRLNTQVLSLTAALVMLQTQGALADIVSFIPV